MTTEFDYGREAETCLEAAEKATSPEGRRFLLAMARVWSNLAGHGDPREETHGIGARDRRFETGVGPDRTDQSRTTS